MTWKINLTRLVCWLENNLEWQMKHEKLKYHNDKLITI